MGMYYFCYKSNIANSYRPTEYIHLFRLLPLMKTPFHCLWNSQQCQLSKVKRQIKWKQGEKTFTFAQKSIFRPTSRNLGLFQNMNIVLRIKKCFISYLTKCSSLFYKNDVASNTFRHKHFPEAKWHLRISNWSAGKGLLFQLFFCTSVDPFFKKSRHGKILRKRDHLITTVSSRKCSPVICFENYKVSFGASRDVATQKQLFVHRFCLNNYF